MSVGISLQMLPCTLWGILITYQRLFTRLKYVLHFYIHNFGYDHGYNM